MARTTKAELAVERLLAKQEGYAEAHALVHKLVAADFSLTVALAALNERRDTLLDEISEARVAATAAKRPAAKKEPELPLTEKSPAPS